MAVTRGGGGYSDHVPPYLPVSAMNIKILAFSGETEPIRATGEMLNFRQQVGATQLKQQSSRV